MTTSYRPSLEWYDEIGSTNDLVVCRAREGARSGLWVAAAAQNAGRGRNGRLWQSPPGNLYASHLVLDGAPRHRMAELGFVAGLALVQTLRRYGGACAEIVIKWPNDMLFRGAKLAGLLVEGETLHIGPICVIGMGINCASYPQGLAYPCCKLDDIAAQPVGLKTLLGDLAEQMRLNLDLYDYGRDFAVIRSGWLEHAHALGHDIEVGTSAGKLRGRFETIDAQGRLVLNLGNIYQYIASGDVFFSSPHSTKAGLP